MSYNLLTHLDEHDFSKKSVLVLGAGRMGRVYCDALKAMGVHKITVVSQTESSSARCIREYGVQARAGGFEKVLPELGYFDLLIVALPIAQLKEATECAIDCGYKDILVEKPGALDAQILNGWSNQLEGSDARLRIAYNRVLYPSFWKAKELSEADGGITSCRYTFTEWTHQMDLNLFSKEELKRWGISNSLHVIGMAHRFIGMPAQLEAFQSGYLPWHSSGSRFVGSGISIRGISFSYHADWESAGRWGIEIMTLRNAYRLIPLEEVCVCAQGSVQWTPVELECTYPSVKAGIAEEIALMLLPDLERKIPLVTVQEAGELARLAEKIFGYDSLSLLQTGNGLKKERVHR